MPTYSAATRSETPARNTSPGGAAPFRRAEERFLGRLALRRLLPADRYWWRPESILADAGITPDAWQADILASLDPELLALCSRQAGKTLAAAALSLMTALREPGSLVLLLSPSARQSGEMLQSKVMPLYRALQRSRPAVLAGGGRLSRQLVMSLEFASGSRIIALPDNPDNIVGYSAVSLLVVDEASRASDELYYSVRPMLATSEGRIFCLSTPKGQRGFFWEEWEKGRNWRRFTVRADQIPRIPAAFLAEEERKMGPRWFRQEYLCHFNEQIDAVFSAEDIAAAESPDVSPLFGGAQH